MASTPRGVASPPNQTHRGNRLNATAPMNHGAPVGNAPNNVNKTNRLASTSPMAKNRPALSVPNESARFTMEDATMGMRPSGPVQVGFGRGAVPVSPGLPKNPFGDTFVPAHMLRRDTAGK